MSSSNFVWSVSQHRRQCLRPCSNITPSSTAITDIKGSSRVMTYREWRHSGPELGTATWCWRGSSPLCARRCSTYLRVPSGLFGEHSSTCSTTRISNHSHDHHTQTETRDHISVSVTRHRATLTAPRLSAVIQPLWVAECHPQTDRSSLFSRRSYAPLKADHHRHPRAPRQPQSAPMTAHGPIQATVTTRTIRTDGARHPSKIRRANPPRTDARFTL